MPKSKDPVEIVAIIRESIKASPKRSRRLLFHNLRAQFGWQVWTADRKELVAQLLKDQEILAQPPIAEAGLDHWIMLSMPIITTSPDPKAPVARPDDKSFYDLMNVRLGPEREVELHYVTRLFHMLGYEDIHEAAGYGFLLHEGISHKRVEADFVYFAGGDHSDKGAPLVLVEAKSTGHKLDAAIEQAKSYANVLRPMYYAVTNGDVFRILNYQGAIPDFQVLEFRREEIQDRFDEIYRLLNRETVTKAYAEKVRKWTEIATGHTANA
jgi:hypothetical protein